MLAKRITPTILMRNGQMVKGKQFRADRVTGSALQAAKVHAMRGVDEILILDVSATQEGREPNYEMIQQLTETTTVPVTIGGGISSIDHVEKLFDSGADKICIGTYVDLIEEVAEKYGSQAVTASLDYWQSEAYIEKAVYESTWVMEHGAGEILLQCKETDGTMDGYDLTLIGAVSNHVHIPVIASGGCSGYEDMLQAILAGADAVAAGALFQFTNSTPKGAAQFLHEQGIEVRL